MSTSVTGAVFHRDGVATCRIPHCRRPTKVRRSGAVQIDNFRKRRSSRQSAVSGDQGNVELSSQLDIESIHKSQRLSPPPGAEQEPRQWMPRDRNVFEVEDGIFDATIVHDSGSVKTPDRRQYFGIDVCRRVSRRVLEATSYRKCGGRYGQ
jgi:hypothetical protein